MGFLSENVAQQIKAGTGCRTDRHGAHGTVGIALHGGLKPRHIAFVIDHNLADVIGADLLENGRNGGHLLFAHSARGVNNMQQNVRMHRFVKR